MARGKRKLTKRVVDDLGADPDGRDVIHFDSEVLGFGVRVKPTGAKSYVLKYRNKFGHQRKFHIAAVGPGVPSPTRTRNATPSRLPSWPTNISPQPWDGSRPAPLPWTRAESSAM